MLRNHIHTVSASARGSCRGTTLVPLVKGSRPASRLRSCSVRAFNVLSFSSGSSRLLTGVSSPCGDRRRRRHTVTRAVFEKFSERSIKSVMIAQQQAKELGASEVGDAATA